ncbi:hypothetical protein ACR9YC_06985 [Parasphingorhabdus sp. DH2-15]|uniref:hypothetical protein n=1 Tax=Parasphingorhabdus sp. DH2-15 TaxID=3444112 RepID=UPI003F689226
MENRKRYSLFDYVMNSKHKLQGVIGLFSGILLVWVYMLILNVAGVFEDSSPYGEITGFWAGFYLGIAFSPPVYFGFTSRFWGKVIIALALAKIAIGVWIYTSDQSSECLQYIEQNTWALFFFFLDGGFFFISIVMNRNQAMRRLARDQDPNAQAAYADYMLQPNAFNRWLVSSRLADRMQGQFTRRCLAISIFISILFMVLLVLIKLSSSILTFDGLPQGALLSENFTILFGEWAWQVVKIVVFIPTFILIAFQMSLRLLMALDHEPIDERQIQMIRFGHADGRGVSLAMLAIMTVLAFLKTPVEIIAAVSLGAFSLAWLTPYMIMAWRLPDGDGSYDENEDVLEINYA